MPNVTSKDGTTIAFDRSGTGTPLILIGGAFADRKAALLVDLAEQLATHFTVINYDRRGRGASGDTAPYEVAREIEDLDALIADAGGSAYVYGLSSGAILAIDAAANGSNILKLALHEPPYTVDDTHEGPPAGLRKSLADLTADGRRDDTVELFLTVMGMPAEYIGPMKDTPDWAGLVKVAHTLSYESALVGEDGSLPTERVGAVTVPTVVIDGANSPEWMCNAVQAVTEALPNASRHSLEGQDHFTVDPASIAPVLLEFFTD
ncbi:alpha/beta fold hydrolase [Actinophytocola sediminis]